MKDVDYLLCLEYGDTMSIDIDRDEAEREGDVNAITTIVQWTVMETLRVPANLS